jgi:hypothetical protein
MLYLHCGWQRTGTSSLQAALSRCQEQLRAAGILYPDRWRPRGNNAHFGIVELFEPSFDEAGVELFKDYLRSNSERTVLISCEGLSNWLPAERRSSLLKLVLAAQEVVPVTCLWTLRSIDRLLTSLYLHRVATARHLPAPADFFRAFSPWLGEAALTMRKLDDAVGGNVSYGRYESGGGHYAEILGSVGMPDALKGEIVAGLQAGPRANVSLGQKGTALLLHVEEIEDRAGVQLPHAALRAALREGKLRFAGDVPCELVGPEVRQTVHEEVLGASRGAGFAPYAEFFEDHEVQPSPAASLDPDVLTGEDLDALRAWLTARLGAEAATR